MTPAEVVNAQLRAYNARDLDAFISTYDENACLYLMPDERVLFRGRAEIAAHYGTKTFQREGLRADLLARIVVGDRVIDHEQSWSSSGPSEVLVIYEVRHDLITAVWFYESRSALEPAGQRSPSKTDA